MGLIIAIACIGGGLCLLAPLAGQLLKSNNDTASDALDQPELVAGTQAG